MKNSISKIPLGFLIIFSTYIFPTYASDQIGTETILHEKPSQPPAKIEVAPKTSDEEITKRIQGILKATNWFVEAAVEVENGVVFLTGKTKHHEFKDWATELSHNTQDVTAVVNKMVVLEPSIIDLHIVIHELLGQGRKIIRSLPSIIFGVIILFMAWIVARITYKLMTHLLRNKVNSSLLHEVIARAISLFVFLMGVYFIFEMAELTTMALTVISGTGLLGIILGIAFRDLAENFLASILLSLQNPFRTHDLIDLICPTSGYTITGYVESLTMRVTILVSLDGNHVQIPNVTVYKSNIVNHTSNPNHRELFSINIGTNYPISKAVTVAVKVLEENEAILKSPEPLVLVQGLEKDLVKLEVSYWINITKYNASKVKSSVMHLIKQAFQAESICQNESKFLGKQETENKALEHHKREKKIKPELKNFEGNQLGQLQGMSSDSHLPEKGENLLNKHSAKRKKEKTLLNQ